MTVKELIDFLRTANEEHEVLIVTRAEGWTESFPIGMVIDCDDHYKVFPIPVLADAAKNGFITCSAYAGGREG